MTKLEIKKANDSELIYDYILTYSTLVCNINLQMGTKRYQKHLEDLNAEMLKREILTPEQIANLNS